jgi:hypothetical protein
MAGRRVFPVKLTCSERRLLDVIAERRGCSRGEALRQLLDESAVRVIQEVENAQGTDDHD